MTELPSNRHGIYPRSNVDDTSLVHAPAYVAATWDGQLSVGPLCGAPAVFRVVSDGAKSWAVGLTPCPKCLALAAQP